MQNAITDIPGIEVGQAQDLEALTGVTVILCRKGAVGGVEVRGREANKMAQMTHDGLARVIRPAKGAGGVPGLGD